MTKAVGFDMYSEFPNKIEDYIKKNKEPIYFEIFGGANLGGLINRMSTNTDRKTFARLLL